MILGLNKTTLLDFPGHLAATVFLGGCNFRCPFCHNAPLVLMDGAGPEISRRELMEFLNKRRAILEGVCVTGGEPTLSPDLPDLLADIKALGLSVKLDTNGSRPRLLEKLCQDGLIDYVAMDIKSSPAGYAAACGISHPDLASIRQSAAFLMDGGIDYEFRTTVAKGLHTAQDFAAIGQWLAGCKQYFLQPYTDAPQVLQPGFQPPSDEDLLTFRRILKRTIASVEIRGRDLS